MILQIETRGEIFLSEARWTDDGVVVELPTGPVFIADDQMVSVEVIEAA